MSAPLLSSSVYRNVWDDLRFPVQSINPPGQASDPDVEASTGILLFDSAGTELVYGVAQMPHTWVEATIVRPHIHWTKTTSAAGDVLWQLDYEWKNVGETFDGDYPNQLQVTETASGTPDTDTAWKHLISPFGPVEMADLRISCMMLWRLSRIGGDAADTYGADARLLEFDVHFQADNLGSLQEFIK